VARVLIIDDTDELLSLLKNLVERSGSIAATVSQPSKIMSIYAQLDPDVVMIDPSMRHTDGMATIEWLVHVGYVGHLIVMSGYPDDEERVHKVLAHAGSRISVTSLPKPFRLQSFHAALLGLVSNRPEAGLCRSGLYPKG
jgi:DNA-binding NtrC family response regulator